MTDPTAIRMGLFEWLVVAILFATPYLASATESPLRYISADLMIVAFVVWRLGSAAKKSLGLDIRSTDVPYVVGAAVLMLVVGDWVVGRALAASGVDILQPRPFFSGAQVFHQEIVTRGLLLASVSRWYSPRWGLCKIVALIFSAGHAAFCLAVSGNVLPLGTLWTLAAFAFAANRIYFATGHIGYTLAIHLSWNLFRFGRQYVYAGHPIDEGRSFQLIESSYPAIAAGALLIAGARAASLAKPFEVPASAVSSTNGRRE